MKYYLEIENEEHMLNAYELASCYHIYSNKNKPHARFVARLLTEYKKALNYEEKFYYRTKKGDMMQVYPSYIYRPLLDKLIDDYPSNKEIAMEFNNKTHYFTIKEGQFKGDDN